MYVVKNQAQICDFKRFKGKSNHDMQEVSEDANVV